MGRHDTLLLVSWRSALGAADPATLPDRVTRVWIPPGDAGTVRTAHIMAGLARTGSVHPLVRSVAARMVATAPGRDGLRQAALIRQWMAAHLSFLRDPTGNELLHTPARMLTMVGQTDIIHVDCDDAAILGASLGRAVGLLSRLVVVGFRSPKAPFSHVWTEVANPVGSPRWVDLDVTRAAQSINPALISRRLMVRV